MGAELTSPGPLPRMFLSSWVDRQRPRQGPRSEDSEPQQPPLRRKRPGCRGRHPGAVTVTLSLFTRAHTRTRAHTHISLSHHDEAVSSSRAGQRASFAAARWRPRPGGGHTRAKLAPRAAQSTACALRSAINRMRSPQRNQPHALSARPRNARGARSPGSHRPPLSPPLTLPPACLPPSLPPCAARPAAPFDRAGARPWPAGSGRALSLPLSHSLPLSAGPAGQPAPDRPAAQAGRQPRA